MKFTALLALLLSFQAFSSNEESEKVRFKKTRNGVLVTIEYKELLGIKAFLDVPTNVSFKPVVECENLGGLSFAHVTFKKKYIRNPETSRFRGGTMVTSYSHIKLKAHKLCDGDFVDVITVNGKNVGDFGQKGQL